MVKSLILSDIISGEYEFINECKYRVTLSELKSILMAIGNRADNLIKSIKRNKKDVIITLISGIVFILSLVIFSNTVGFSSYVFMIVSSADFFNNLVKRVVFK